jgi:hypothetical protein
VAGALLVAVGVVAGADEPGPLLEALVDAPASEASSLRPHPDTRAAASTSGNSAATARDLGMPPA